MIKTLNKIKLVGINSKFIHSNLAIASIEAYVKKYSDFKISKEEYTINQPIDVIVKNILKDDITIIGLSCYIWNISMIKDICFTIKSINPTIQIILGGPQVSYNPNQVLEEFSCDYIICGEGEETFLQLIKNITNNEKTDKILQGVSVSLENIPFVYDDLDYYKDRIIYYEASRGCPFKCAYCLSASKQYTKNVRFLDINRVYSDLYYFIKNNISQVKFVDRTFNCNKEFAYNIFDFLINHDNGITNFHFEIAIDLLDDNILSLLKKARKGLFQFEIGIQSFNEDTLQIIKRQQNFDKITSIINTLLSYENIHLHIDLIAGLPQENLISFKNSFNKAYSLNPHVLQLGFLKVLDGTPLKDLVSLYGIKYNNYPPFEVVQTNVLSYKDLSILKNVEQVLELYYNTNRFNYSIKYILNFFKTSFDFYYDFSQYFVNNNLIDLSHSKNKLYTILFNYFKNYICDSEKLNRFKEYLKLDLYCNENIKSLPSWLDNNILQYKNYIFDFLDNNNNQDKYLHEYKEFDTKQLYRNVHIDVFSFNPVNNNQEQTFLLFNYRKKDLLGNCIPIEIKLKEKYENK